MKDQIKINDKVKIIPNKKTARKAGLLWFILIILGLFAQFYVHDKLIIPDDSSKTIHNIIENDLLYRLGFVSHLLMNLLTIFTSLALYRLLRSINKTLAILMVAFAMLGSVINMINILNLIAPILLLSNEYYLNTFGVDQIGAQVMLYTGLYEQGYFIAQIFFMIWVFPLGILVYRSRFLPRIFGVLFMFETFFGLISTAISFLSPNILLETAFLIPAAIAEILFMFWLLIRGTTDK